MVFSGEPLVPWAVGETRTNKLVFIGDPQTPLTKWGRALSGDGCKWERLQAGTAVSGRGPKRDRRSSSGIGAHGRSRRAAIAGRKLDRAELSAQFRACIA